MGPGPAVATSYRRAARPLWAPFSPRGPLAIREVAADSKLAAQLVLSVQEGEAEDASVWAWRRGESFGCTLHAAPSSPLILSCGRPWPWAGTGEEHTGTQVALLVQSQPRLFGG